MLPHSVTPLRDGFVTLHIDLQAASVAPILQVFSAMYSLSQSVTFKTKTATAPERLAEQKILNEAYYLSYCNAITSKFDEYYLMGEKVNDCIKLTNKSLKPLFPNTCYDGVKQILAKANRLKNKSFNCKKKS